MIALVAAALAAPEPPQDEDALWVDTGAGCASVTAIETIPAANATGVPVDVHPSIVFDGECGAAALDLRVTNPATSELLAQLLWTLPVEVPAIATIVPDAHLPPDTDLVLSATSTEGWGELVAIPFRTGPAAAGPLVGTLTIDVLETTWEEGDAPAVRALVEVVPVPDPTGLSLVRVTGLTGAAWFRSDELAEPVELTFPAVSVPEQVCFQAVQFDGLGVGIGPASDCAPLVVPESGGCGCDGTGATGGLAAALALLLVRRRR